MPVKVLVVDDDETNGLILQRLLEREGFNVVRARNGAEAVNSFGIEWPDIVLMDINMPVMDGYEATRRIRAEHVQKYTPVLFLTAVQDERALARCIEVGGDDFLTKPYNHVILQAKIRSFLRLSDMHSTIRQQNEELSVYQEQLRREQEIAEKIFNNVVRGSHSLTPGVRCLSSPTSIFNGDLLLTAQRANGELHVLVGDFTGHGLSAAVGTVPVSDVFYSMTSNGFSIGDIAEAINKKLNQIMPTNIFFAACLMSVDTLDKSLVVWNGGMPEVLVVDSGNRITQRATSKHLPMGILSAEAFGRDVEIFRVNSGDRVFACSDGLIDAPIATGGRFSWEGYTECFEAPVPPQKQFDFIIDTLREIRGEGPQDDLTLIEIAVDAQPEDPVRAVRADTHTRAATAWQVQFQLAGQTLRHCDPLPLVMRSLAELQGFDRHKEVLYTVIAELYVNALDHGILKLDSKMKASPAGFATYYAERDARLAQLQEGSVRLSLRHAVVPGGGRLTITVEDSGAGFDYRKNQLDMKSNLYASGRGLSLLRTLCESVEYRGAGNVVEAVFVWKM